jgi:hypothetical protein
VEQLNRPGRGRARPRVSTNRPPPQIAAASLEDGLDETISVKRLRFPKKLERQLSTTNAIGFEEVTAPLIDEHATGQAIWPWVYGSLRRGDPR